MNVAILGASDNPERYSYKALVMLEKNGHTPIPVHPKLPQVQGHPCYATLEAVAAAGIPIHTLTMYVGPDISSKLTNSIVKLAPKRVIFNPGSENPTLESALRAQGIEVEEACTLVLLSTGQFS